MDVSDVRAAVDPERPLDLLVIGAGPTGLAIGAAAIQAGLEVAVLDRGGLCDGIRQYPTDLQFFTTRERLEIAGVPFAIPDAKPNRKQALAYYREVARHWRVPLVLHQTVTNVRRAGDGFEVTRLRSGANGNGNATERRWRAGAVALASGYFGKPIRLGVPGEDLPWVSSRYREAYGHFGDRVVVVGAGNTAAEAALELYRWGAQVTVIHRGAAFRPGVKYWLKPDLENRIAEGSIPALMHTTVEAFVDGHSVSSPMAVEVRTPEGRRSIPADAAYVLIGYLPELELARQVGVTLEPETLIPRVDPETCESDVPGFFIAGTIQAGKFTNRIFIENSRDHGPRIVACLARRRGDDAVAGELLAAVGPAGREALLD
ncbi:MAG TPA: NAD(P)-binding domain-containing protein [Thermoanaerobaculia bacterium]|nr:NAD(P)-binding domain-containing protein [Thermoanaerobaculia bacterium]